LSILSESRLLALAPVLVESPHFLTQVLHPDRVEGVEATRSLHIATRPTMTRGGVSMMVTASQVSFLWSSAEHQIKGCYLHAVIHLQENTLLWKCMVKVRNWELLWIAQT